MNESLLVLIKQAKNMLIERSDFEQDLIYHIACMTEEERGAIIFAYETLHQMRDE